MEMNSLKFWVDDVRPAPKGFIHVHSVDEMLSYWKGEPDFDLYIDVLSLDHDAGDYRSQGGDYIKILDYMDNLFNTDYKDHGWNYDIKFHFHSANPVGVENMRRIVRKNGWREIEEI